VWTFCARQLAANTRSATGYSPDLGYPADLGYPPDWLVFHHLPVPALFKTPQDSHPLIDRILRCVDGKNSIQQIGELTAAHFPQGLEPRATLVDILAELLNLEKPQGEPQKPP
jgi:hypothetical protein